MGRLRPVCLQREGRPFECVSVCREGVQRFSRVWRAVVKEERPSSSKIRRRKGLQIYREILRQKKSEVTR